MGVLNTDANLIEMLNRMDARIRHLEQSKRFTAPYVSADPSNPTNGDLWIRSDQSRLYGEVAGSPLPLGNVFVCTSSTRPASPFNGMTIFETDTNETLVYYSTPAVWRKFWQMPWGSVLNNQSNANQATFNANTQIGNIPNTAVTLTGNRRLKLTCTFTFSGTTVGDVMTVQAYRDSTPTNTVGDPIRVTTAVANQVQTVTFQRFFTSTTGSNTFTVWAQRTTGAGTFTVFGASNTTATIVEDVGPQGNPA